MFAPLLFAVKLFDLNSAARAAAGRCRVLRCPSVEVSLCERTSWTARGTVRHPVKRLRPIAAGDISVGLALTTAVGIAAVAMAGAVVLGWRFAAVSAFYLILQTLYSVSLKHIVIIDALTLAIGFVVRAIAGAVVIDVVISHWLFVCTILLALFIALAKRRHELVLLADGAASHRPILDEYSAYLLDQMIAVVTASTLIAYIFYTISPETEEKFGHLVVGPRRFHSHSMESSATCTSLCIGAQGGGSPSDLLLNDRPLLACVALWAVGVAVIIYHLFTALTMPDFTARS